MMIFVVVLVGAGVVVWLIEGGTRVPSRRPCASGLVTGAAFRIDVSRLLGRSVRRALGRRADANRDRVVGRALVAAAGLWFVSPVLAIAAFAAQNASGVVQKSRSNRQRDELVAEGLAEVVDLFAVMMRGGYNMAAAVREAGRWIEGPVGASFEWCSQQSAQGQPIADALEDLPERLGSQVRPLVSALIANERHGAPIATGLFALAADHRAARRRLAEAAARRLPVHLLVPLIVCVLPAFMFLTVVPVVAETFRTLDVFSSP